ncbi:MAG: RrF2 family transcriptional regulator [Ilumatobacteraceae bacterium]
MRLGEGVEWAVHCCTVLGAMPPAAAVSGARLAEFHGVPAPYLVKQLQKLSQAGIVQATTGRNGGYRLARPASKVTLLDVVLALEGEEHAFRCTEIRQQGPSAVDARRYVRPCGIARAMWRAEDAWRKELRAVTIADINTELAASVDPKQVRKALEWFEEVS